jgi:hypothetical protein
MVPECHLLAASRGVVTAPAGCGKTHLIAAALAQYTGPKPILILTHTNAGVAALRDRLQRGGVLARHYRLFTVDGWLMRLLGTFPGRSGHAAGLLDVRNPRSDYPEIRRRALALLTAGHLFDVLRSSYAYLIVDEYQDCSVTQHQIIQQLTHVLASCVLGDPMQAIFGFAERVAHWDHEVRTHFQDHAQLSTPWRWRNAGAEPLGQWLLQVRNELVQGRPIDLRTGPAPFVTWVHTDGQSAPQKRLQAAATRAPSGDHRVLVIGDAMRVESRHKAAASTPGAVVVETVELKDLIDFAGQFRLDDSATGRLLEFAERMLTHASARDMLQRLDTLAAGRARKPASSAEVAALEFRAVPTHEGAARVLSEIHEQPHVRVVRPAMLFSAIKALRRAATSNKSFLEAAIAVREEARLMGRPLPKRGVGSTLLLKGLEAEVAVILEADRLDRLSLYVAMTRGSTRLVVCSESPVLGR